MSTHDEDRLSRGLHDRAGDMHGAPLDLDEVLRTARGIRRRRQVLAGVAAAVVVAVAVPVGLMPPAAPAPTGRWPPRPRPLPAPRRDLRLALADPGPAEAAVPLTVDGAPSRCSRPGRLSAGTHARPS